MVILPTGHSFNCENAYRVHLIQKKT